MALTPVIFNLDIEPHEQLPAPGEGTLESAGRSFGYVNELRGKLERLTGAPVNFCWNFRMDRHMRACFGDADILLKTFDQQIQNVAEQGDMMGLHVHVIESGGRNGGWRVNYANKQLVTDTIGEALDRFKSWFGYTTPVTRLGEMWVGQHAIEQIQDAGVRYELSVESGLRPNFMSNVHRNSGSVGWRPSLISAPRTPWKPDPADFRKASADNSGPMWMIPLTSYRRTDIASRGYLAKAAVSAVASRFSRIAPRDIFRPQTYYAPKFIFEKMTVALEETAGAPISVAIRNFRWSERINNFLDEMINSDQGRSIRFVTPDQAISLWKDAEKAKKMA